VNRSESHADANTPPPDHAAFLFHVAVEKLEPLRYRHHREDLNTRAAGRIVDQTAGKHGELGAHDDLGLGCLGARGPDALI